MLVLFGASYRQTRVGELGFGIFAGCTDSLKLSPPLSPRSSATSGCVGCTLHARLVVPGVMFAVQV